MAEAALRDGRGRMWLSPAPLGTGAGEGPASPILGALGGFSHQPLISLLAFIALDPAVPRAILGQLLGLVGGEVPERDPSLLTSPVT